VDRRAAVIARAEPGDLLASIGETGEVLVQGLFAGRMEGFTFVPDPALRDAGRPLLAAANRALRAGAGDRVQQLVEDADASFALGATVGALQPEDRQQLARLGVSVGRQAVWVPALLRADTLRLRALLWTLRNEPPSVGAATQARAARPLPGGQPSVPLDPRVPS